MTTNLTNSQKLIETIADIYSKLFARGKWVDVTFNNSNQAVVNDVFIKNTTCVDTWVVKTGTTQSYAYEYETDNGVLTVKASDAENCTLRMLLVNEITD